MLKITCVICTVVGRIKGMIPILAFGTVDLVASFSAGILFNGKSIMIRNANPTF